MTAGRTPAEALLHAAVDAGVTPGACLAFGRVGEPPVLICAGTTEYGPDASPVTDHTIYDLASLTKPLCTTAAAMLLAQQGALDLDAPLSKYLPTFRGGLRERVRVRHLLAHESGLVWWLPLYRELAPLPAGPARLAAVRRRILELNPELEPGCRAVYSDPGFLLLHEVLLAAGGQPPAALAKRALWDRWGLELRFVDLLVTPGGSSRPATVSRHALLADRSVASTEDCPWRKRVLRAEVHDDNAHFMGGVAPHAGLFGTALDVLGFGLGLLGCWLGLVEQPLERGALDGFLRRRGEAAGSTWVLGWDTPSPSGSSAGRLVSAKAVGHLGFTGTSLWIDPTRQAAVVLLTNRVHPTRSDERIKELRPAVHDAVWALLDARPAGGGAENPESGERPRGSSLRRGPLGLPRSEG